MERPLPSYAQLFTLLIVLELNRVVFGMLAVSNARVMKITIRLIPLG